MSIIKPHTRKTKQGEPPVKGRFAPSPTGRMHAGNIFSALVAWLIAKSQGGKIVLRIEDLDAQRSKQRYIDAVMRDFEALGLFWDEGPFFQHDREETYENAFRMLEEKGLVYPCFCTRADLHAASAPHAGERFVYSGTCRSLDSSQRFEKSLVRTPAERLIVPDEFIEFDDCIQGRVCQNLSRECGDFVVRGVDLLSSTPQQMHLQNLLGLAHPAYAHVPLLVAKDGRRLSKRNSDAELDALIARFGSHRAVIGQIAGMTGLASTCDPIAPEELLHCFDPQAFSESFIDKKSIVWE